MASRIIMFWRAGAGHPAAKPGVLCQSMDVGTDMLLLLRARALANGSISVYIVGMSLLSCWYATLFPSYYHASVPVSTPQFWSYKSAN